MKLTELFTRFFNSEWKDGVVLIFCSVLSLMLANFFHGYESIWHYEVANHQLVHWINDGLMAIFFLLIGLELEREIYVGELSSIKDASLPIFGAIGGMIVPASIYYIINFRQGDVDGIGIPMATDIAFALAVLSLLGSRIPSSLKVFITALAVIDDLGVIIIIAIFYTTSINLLSLGVALGIFVLLLLFNLLRVRVLWPRLLAGVFMWYFMYTSGVHPTIAGVLLAFAIPFGNGGKQSPSYRLQHFLHKPVSFFILPVFALANTSIVIQDEMFYALSGAISLGIMAGLLIGKPTGIIVFSYLATRLNLSNLPAGMTWKHLIGGGFLGGIGFTVSIFITLLAFTNTAVIEQSKIAVMIISLVAGIIGYTWLTLINRKN